MIKDEAHFISNIEWTVSGKVSKITYNDPDNPDKVSTSFLYDAKGNRVLKTDTKNNAGVITHNNTYYSLDAQGNQMAIYEWSETTPVILNSRNIYGSSRLGTDQEAVVMTSGHTEDIYQYKLGYKAYELANHLGNVLNVVSDMKYYDATANYYKADVISGTNYYPFGMTLSDELYAGNYPYGFNGMEKDDESISFLSQEGRSSRIYYKHQGSKIFF